MPIQRGVSDLNVSSTSTNSQISQPRPIGSSHGVSNVNIGNNAVGNSGGGSGGPTSLFGGCIFDDSEDDDLFD